MSDCIKTDVFISGGGPVGLLIAYSLARQGVQSVLVGKTTPSPPSISLQQRIIMHQNLTKAEQHNKENQAMYGRATTLYPRTLEMLDQLDLLEDLNQIGYIGQQRDLQGRQAGDLARVACDVRADAWHVS